MKDFLSKRFLFILFGLLALANRVSAHGPIDSVRASKYLATMQFDGNCAGNCPEPNFPQRIDFNTTQDANGDSLVNAEDAMENLVRFAIGDSILDTGRTGLPNRGPNDQRPAVYFNHLDRDSFQVYQYWHYYADNDWVNNHEHDVQYYFVYEKCGVPLYILLSYHNFTNMFKWEEIAKDDGHPLFDVEAGSHGYQNDNEHDGVRIRYNGEIHERNGKLITPDSVTIPWLIFSNDSMVKDAQPFVEKPDTMYKGDPAYPFPNPCEYCNGKASPWLRTAWDSVKMPQGGNCPDPVADFEPFGSGYQYVFLDSSRGANEWYWDFGDGSKDTGFYPMHTYDSAGTYEVCLSVVDSCMERADCICKTLEVSDTSSSLAKHEAERWELKVAPNPVRTDLTVTLPPDRDLRKIRVRSLSGRTLKEFRPEPIGAGRYRLSMKGLPQGMLMLEFEGENWKRSKKVVKEAD